MHLLLDLPIYGDIIRASKEGQGEKKLKKMVRARIMKEYEGRLAKVNDRGTMGAFMIDISRKCSAYELSWEEFIELRKMASRKAGELKMAFRY